MPTKDEISAVKKVLAEYLEESPALVILARDVLQAAEVVRVAAYEREVYRLYHDDGYTIATKGDK